MTREYRQDFQLYDEARRRYMQDLDDIALLLGHFTGDPARDEKSITVTDLARLEGLRIERDLAYVEFVRSEAAIFRQLISRLLPDDADGRGDRERGSAAER